LATNHFQNKWLPTYQILKNGCSPGSPTNFNNFGWPPTIFCKKWLLTNQFEKMVGHQPNSEKKQVVHCSPTTFKKMVGHRPFFFKYGCPPTTLKQIGWPSTNFEKMLLTNHFPKKNGWPPANFFKIGRSPTN